jgi:hypothetical protein
VGVSHPSEDVLINEIETWRDFIDKLPSDDDKVIFTKLLNDCYKYSVAINNQASTSIRIRVFNHVYVVVPAQTNQSFKVYGTISAFG